MSKSLDVSRRHFLKKTGLLAGAAAAAPAILSPTKTSKAVIEKLSLTGNKLKVGVLLPMSTIHPTMPDNFLAGIKLYFEQISQEISGLAVKIITEETGFGPSSALKKSQKLIEKDGVDIVVGLVGTGITPELRELFEESKTILLACNVGENIVRKEEESPYIVHNSLNTWQANWAMANWAAENLGKKAFVTSSFYESGYDAPYAFNVGFESAGGKILQNFVNHIPESLDDTDKLLSEIKAAKPDFVYASYSGHEAVEFVKAYHESGLANEIPLIGSAFLVDESILPAQGAAALGIKTCMPWSSHLTIAENQSFMRAYQRQTSRTADAFALLGFDAAHIILSVAATTRTDLRKSRAAKKAVAAAEINSPRGNVKLSKSLSPASSLYLREVRKQEGILSNQPVEQIDHYASSIARKKLIQSDLQTGWLNPYLCA